MDGRKQGRARSAMLGKLALLLVLVSTGTAHAYTVHTCTEAWYPTAKPGQSISDLRAERIMACQPRKVEKRQGMYGVIDGKGYFMTQSQEVHHACNHSGPAPDFACLIPAPFRRNEVVDTRNYYLVTVHGGDLRILSDRYVTDGRSVFSDIDLIPAADAASFTPFTPDGAGPDSRWKQWAHDRAHVYQEGKPIPGMQGGPVEIIDETFAVNGGHVFELDVLNGVKPRPDVNLPLTLLAASQPLFGNLISDGERIYLAGVALAGVRASNFHLLAPACPVPGWPDLRCRSDVARDSTSSKFHLARDGADVLYFGELNNTMRIAHVPDFVYFQPAASGEFLGISGHRLFQLNQMNDSYGKEFSVDFSGHLMGPMNGYLADDAGFFSINDLNKNGNLLCGGVATLAWPGKDGVPRFGQLHRLSDNQVPNGFKVALENARFRYLFVSEGDSAYDQFDTVVDLHDGRRMQAGWCGDDIKPQIAPVATH